MSDIEIRRHPLGASIADFLAAGRAVFADDPHWIPPLGIMMKDQLSPKSPFFQHADACFFTAHKAGEPVGRISAQIDHEHLRRYDDATGFFGFFDTTDDADVAAALLSAANQWLKQRSLKRMRGPMNLSVNQEIGLLVEGFSTPPMVMMPHSRDYQDSLYSRIGLEKAKDLFAWRFDVAGDMPKRAQNALAEMRELGVVFRSVHLKTEMDQLIEIQDNAWRHNWGHVSMTPAEAHQLRTELSLLIDKDIAIVCEVEGQLAGMALAIPNLNEAIADFGGGLDPLKVAKLLWRLKATHPKSARVAMLGIKEEFRKQRKYMPLALALVCFLNQRGRECGYKWAELSWTVEDNAPVSALIRSAGGKIYKRYRIYEKDVY